MLSQASLALQRRAFGAAVGAEYAGGTAAGVVGRPTGIAGAGERGPGGHGGLSQRIGRWPRAVKLGRARFAVGAEHIGEFDGVAGAQRALRGGGFPVK